MNLKNRRQFSNVEKSYNEKRAYFQILDEPKPLEKTADEEVDIAKTNSSKYDVEDSSSTHSTPAVKEKSIFLKIRDLDWLRGSFGIGVIIAIVVACLGFGLSVTSNLSSQGTDIQTLKDTQKETAKELSDLSKNITNLDKNFSVFQESVKKDIQYIFGVEKKNSAAKEN